MTAQDVLIKYPTVTMTTLTKQWKRAQAKIEKEYHVKLVKEGRGADTNYREVSQSDNRAKTIFEALAPIHETGIIKNDLSMENFTFTVFMGVITTPMFVFRGTYKDFLGYLEIQPTEKNIQALKDSIDKLVNEMIFHEIVDTTGKDEEVITLSLVRKAELDMKINVNMISICQQLVENYRLKSGWVPLLKMWLGTELLSKQEHYTRQELMDMTGLSIYQINKYGQILKDSNIYKTSRAYEGYQKCIGMKADMNIENFYEVK